MRQLAFLLVLISPITFSQTEEQLIVCGPSVRKINVEAARISTSPQKLSLTDIDSTIQDSTVVSQQEKGDQLIIGFPRAISIYPGFTNLIQVAFPNKPRRVKLECVGCDTLYQLSEKNRSEWVVIAKDSNQIVLSLVNKKGNAISKTEIPVLPLPTPTMFLDGLDAQSILTFLPKHVSLKYDETIPLSVKFGVKRWEIRINGGPHYGGYGSAIPQNVLDEMKTTKRGTISIYLSYFGPNGIQETREIFGFNIK